MAPRHSPDRNSPPNTNEYHRRPTPPRHRHSRSRSPARNSASNLTGNNIGRPSTTSIYRRRSPPKPRRTSPSPIRDSPPRDLPHKRPGGTRGRGRNVLAEQERLAAEREREQEQAVKRQRLGVQDISNQFYNARPEWVKERGREWRRTESQIKGLRAFNNWVKSCMIQKFSPEEKAEPEELGWGEVAREPEEQKPLLILDIGCGKGGDLGKWQLAPQQVGLYVGLDPAETSIRQANDRYMQMRRGRRPIFDARLLTQDCFGEWIGDVGIIREVGIDPFAGQPGRSGLPRGRGFDVVSAMFSMHYAFESQEKVKMLLRNVAGSLKKGGRFVGVVPNSDAIASKVRKWYTEQAGTEPSKESAKPSSDPESRPDPSSNAPSQPVANGGPQNPEPPGLDSSPSFGNSIYTVRFPYPSVPPHIFPASVAEGRQFSTFRPPYGWKYTYWMAEAVDVPEFVVPWEAFRAEAEEFGLEQRYRRGFLEIWESEKGDKELGPLAVRMGVTRTIGGSEGERLEMTDEEREAVGLYSAFCFVKV